MRKIFIDCSTKTLEEFKRLAEIAAELGATHVYVSEIIKSMWQWNRDRTDPYPNWNIRNAAVFKFVVPDELKDFLPSDYADRNLEILAAKAEILKKWNLKGAMNLWEPVMLPEEIFLKHPEWRGPRCDHPRRARRPYHAACTDNPEVRRLYVGSVEKLCRVLPVEQFYCYINDSGSGVCWTSNLYCGPNGNTACRHLTYADRAINFMSAVQQGAEQAGVRATVGIIRALPEEAAATASRLKPGQFIGKYGYSRIFAGQGSEMYAHTYPVVGIPQIISFAEEIEKMHLDQDSDCIIGFPSVESVEHIEFVKKFKSKKYTGVTERYLALNETADSLVGSASGPKLSDAWENIYRGIETIKHLSFGEHILLAGCVNERWLTRPFVPFPHELSPDEKDYYRAYQFQATTEEEADNLMNTQGFEFLYGFSSMALAGNLIGSGKAYFNRAIELINSITDDNLNPSYSLRLQVLAKRLKALNLVLNNAMNAVQFQEILDRTDFSVTPQDNTKAWTDTGDQRWRDIRDVYRAEIDNTAALISLLESTDEILIPTAESKDDEDIFTLGHDLTDQLRKKIKIMIDHAMDFDRLYSKGNL